MKNWKQLMLTAAALLAMSSVPDARAQSRPTQPLSVESSRSSGTPAKTNFKSPSGVINACAAAADELAKSRLLIDTLAAENDALKTRLDTERQLTAVLTELDTTRRAEADALRGTVKSKDEALNAKDAVIAADDKLIAALKAKKPSAWRRLADILIGAGIVAIAK